MAAVTFAETLKKTRKCAVSSLSHPRASSRSRGWNLGVGSRDRCKRYIAVRWNERELERNRELLRCPAATKDRFDLVKRAAA